ncbi:MAG TPA: NAD(P)H-hydrate dehydratase [Patescibacteria group bacterium]|nr:NAD(P)H-hydrate dehydratase [Patescibacteria group bacterium]
MRQIDKTILKQLRLPRPASHKRDNGRLLIVAGSGRYHGSLVYAVKAASRLVDLTYVLSTPENQKLIAKMKLLTAEFMPAPEMPQQGREYDFDCILIGPGLGISDRTVSLVKRALATSMKVVLDADALNVLDDPLKKLLGANHILTPHRGEFRRLFRMPPTVDNAYKMTKRYGCTIVLKGPSDIITNPKQRIYECRGGNAGMTKGGTGDVLAGLIAALFCTNTAFVAAAAGSYINKAAGDELYRRVGTFYDAEDLVEQVPKTFYKLTRS